MKEQSTPGLERFECNRGICSPKRRQIDEVKELKYKITIEEVKKGEKDKRGSQKETGVHTKVKVFGNLCSLLSHSSSNQTLYRCDLWGEYAA